jgi:hypothetical protein
MSPEKKRNWPAAKSHQAARAPGRFIRMPTTIATTPERPSRLMSGPLPASGGKNR